MISFYYFLSVSFESFIIHSFFLRITFTYKLYSFIHWSFSGWTALSQAARDKGININPVKLNSGRHETNLRAMEVDAKTLRGKGFNPSLTEVPVPFSALLAYLENLAPSFDDLKVILPLSC